MTPRFKWNFVVADVRQPILGSDFLSHENITVNCRRRQLTLVGENNSRETPCSAPNARLTQLHIDTTCQSIASRPRLLSKVLLEATRRNFDTLLANGTIRSSSSPWNFSLVVVKKGYGSYRPCGDYRLLNVAIKPDRYPLSRILELLEKAASGTMLSTLDLTKAYHQILINPENRENYCNHINWTIRVYDYAIREVFQRNMNSILQPWCEFAASYIDNVIIFSKTTSEHEIHLKQTMELLREAVLKINETKWTLRKMSVEFLGYRISNNASKSQGHPKSEAINELQETTPIAFYQWMMPRLSGTMAFLHDLTVTSTKDRRKFVWTSQHTSTFQEALKKLSNITEITRPEANVGSNAFNQTLSSPHRRLGNRSKNWLQTAPICTTDEGTIQ